MASGRKNIRLDNIKRAREVWRLKISGTDIKSIASQLAISTHSVTEILKYTVATHYTAIIQKPSYYDSQLLIQKKITVGLKKLQKAKKSIVYQKKILYILLEATAIAIVALIVL